MSPHVFHNPWINHRSLSKPKFMKQVILFFYLFPNVSIVYKNKTVFLLGSKHFYFGFKLNKIIFKETLNKLFIMVVHVLGNIA